MKRKNIKAIKLNKKTITVLLKPEIIKGGSVRTRTTKYTVCGCVTARSVNC